MAKKTSDRTVKNPFSQATALGLGIGALDGDSSDVRKEKARQFTKAYDEALKQIFYFVFCRSGLNTQFNLKASIDIYGMDDWAPAIIALAPYRKNSEHSNPQDDFCLHSDHFLKNFCDVTASLTDDRDDITPIYHAPTQCHHIMIQSPEAAVELLERMTRFANMRTQDHVPVYMTSADHRTPLVQQVEEMERSAIEHDRIPIETIRVGQQLYRPIAIYSGRAQSDIDAEHARRNPPDVQFSIERLRAMVEQMRGLEGQSPDLINRGADEKSPTSGLYYSH